MVARPHRHGPRQRLAARRGHRRGRGHDAVPGARPSTRATAFFVDADCHPRPSRWSRTRAEPLGIEVVVGDPAADLAPADVPSACCSSTRARRARCATCARSLEARPRGRAAWSSWPPTCSPCTLLVPPGELGRRRRRRLVPALRRAARLRRAPRRLHGHPRAAPALAARPPGRRLGRRRRPPRLPPRPADPRAAHPPGEGHLQHLHRPGAAGRHGRDVRRVPRPRRASRRIAERVHRLTAVLAAGLLRDAGLERRPRRVLRHAAPCGCRAGPPRSSRARPPARHQPPPRRRRHASGSRFDETTTARRRWPTCWRGLRRRPTAPDRRRPGGRRRGMPRRRSAAPASSSPTRCSTRTAPRPRCCATCAAWPTATSPSTGR